MLFAAIAAIATVLTFAMPLLAADALGKRMKAVALEREKMRAARARAACAAARRSRCASRRSSTCSRIVDQFNLNKWLGQEEARSQLVQAGYRGQAPYVTFLFFRMVMPIGVLADAAVLRLRRAQARPAGDGQDRHVPRRRLCRHARCRLVREEQDRASASSRSGARFRTRSTCC